MANKKKIEERLQELQTQKTQRRIRLLGGGVIVIALALLGYMLLNSDHSPNFKPVTSALPAATEASSEEENTVKRYSAYPPMTIDRAKKYFAVVKMEKGGEFTIQLFPDKAPLAVNSFVFLARDGYFDGVTFHRVLDGFMAQGGDPTGTGMGDPGYAFDNEDSDLKFDKAGVVAMANAGR
ncbi:MAG TPA: peptidylprolyl isomerase, partial [Anaerolineales bacterium]|nr:peptidylprolyl isomerase [Anaerolineales bacterium]